MQSPSKSLLYLALIYLLPLISAGTLYGVATPGRQKLDVYKIDPQVGKATANVTTLHLANSIGTCSKLQLSFDNRTRELAINCNDDLHYVQVWWNWQVGSISMPDIWGKGSVVNIVPTWDDTFGGNCALVLSPPTFIFEDYTMGNVMCFSMGAQVNINITYAPYKWMKKFQPYIPSTPTQNIGIFNYATKYDVILWGQSIADNSSNLIQIDSRNIMIDHWYSFMKLDVPIDWLYGSTSYSNHLMRDYIVIELRTGVIVLDRTTKSTSGLIQFCQGHAKMGSSAFDPVNAIMYSIVSCFDGPKLVTFDIGNRAIKNVVNFDEDNLKIKGLFYTL